MVGTSVASFHDLIKRKTANYQNLNFKVTHRQHDRGSRRSRDSVSSRQTSFTRKTLRSGEGAANLTGGGDGMQLILFFQSSCSMTNNVSDFSDKETLTLSPGSPREPGGPEEPGGPVGPWRRRSNKEWSGVPIFNSHSRNNINATVCKTVNRQITLIL